jgi:hypothetical protein
VSAPADRLLSEGDAEGLQAQAISLLATYPYLNPATQSLALGLLAFARDRSARQELAGSLSSVGVS